MMDREQAEPLLALLVADELDGETRAALLAYLQTDDELNERLDDLRQAAALLGDALRGGPQLELDANRRAALLAEAAGPRRLRFAAFVGPYLRPGRVASAAAMVALAVLSGLLLIPRDEGPQGGGPLASAPPFSSDKTRDNYFYDEAQPPVAFDEIAVLPGALEGPGATAAFAGQRSEPVSYTHLTLPTKRIV